MPIDKKPAKLAAGCWNVVPSAGTMNPLLSSQECACCRGSGVQVSAVLRFLIRNSCPGGWMLQEERGTILQCVGLGMGVCLSSCVLELLTGDVTDVAKSCCANLQVTVGMRMGVCLSTYWWMVLEPS